MTLRNREPALVRREHAKVRRGPALVACERTLLVPATPPRAWHDNSWWACRPIVTVQAGVRSENRPSGRRSSPSAWQLDFVARPSDARNDAEPSRRERAEPFPVRGTLARCVLAVSRGAPAGSERERERERCIDADASTYGLIRARKGSRHVCPQRTHAKTTPHQRSGHTLSQEPSAKLVKSIQKTDPNPNLSLPAPAGGRHDKSNIHSW